MPGKQMSIDAELRSGGITQEEARRQRKALSRESQFYGAMDGAMKFVKGDAIAGIVITSINIIGGLAIGVGMHHMSAVDALETYGLLTIGDGLVSQIPALLISTAAGLVVTRVASEEEDASLGGDVASQIFGNPRALTIGAIFLLGLAIVPGLPAVPFLLLAGVFAAIAHQVRKHDSAAGPPVDQVVARKEAARETKARQAMVPLVVPVAVDVADDLAAEVLGDGGDGPLLADEVPRLRDELFLDLGVALPGVRARRAPYLEPGTYVLSMQEVPVGSGVARPDALLALEPAGALAGLGVDGEDATDPATGTAGVWVAADARDVLEASGVEVLEPAGVISRHLGRAVRRRAHDLVGLQEVQTMLDQLERAYPALVRNVVPKPVTLALLADILRRLVEEGISIRPLREILEALATYAPNERDPVSLTELVRASLRRQITHHHARDGMLAVYLLDPTIEEAVRDSIKRTATGSYLAMPPDMAKDVIEAVQRECVPPADGSDPILLTQADVRRFVRRLIEVEAPETVVLSYQELAPEVTVQPIARVGL